MAKFGLAMPGFLLYIIGFSGSEKALQLLAQDERKRVQQWLEDLRTELDECSFQLLMTKVREVGTDGVNS